MNFIWAIAIMVVSYAIQALTAKKPVGVADAKPNTFEDFQFPQFTEGTAQPVVFGDCWTADWMVLGVTNYRTEAIRAKSTGGKKGGGK